jgi:hypothetical protein
MTMYVIADCFEFKIAIQAPSKHRISLSVAKISQWRELLGEGSSE